MAIEKFVVPYELFVRFGEDGSVLGCHKRSLEILKDTETGTIENTKEGDPQPVSGPEMDAFLGVVNTGLIKSLAAEKEANQTLFDESQNTINTLQSNINILEGQLTLRTTMLEQLTNELAQVKSENEQLKAESET